MHGAGYHDATRGRFGFEAGGYIDAIAVEVLTLDDQVAQMQANAEDQALRLGSVGLAHRLLELDGGGFKLCLHQAGKPGSAPHNRNKLVFLVDDVGAAREPLDSTSQVA